MKSDGNADVCPCRLVLGGLICRAVLGHPSIGNLDRPISTPDDRFVRVRRRSTASQHQPRGFLCPDLVSRLRPEHTLKEYDDDDQGQQQQIQTQPTAIDQSLASSSKNGQDLSVETLAAMVANCHGRKTNQIWKSKRQRKSPYPLVALLHGYYYNGASCYYRNMAGLASFYESVYSLDCLLGCELRSSRPEFGNLRAKTSVESAKDSTKKKMVSKKMVLLVGHFRWVDTTIV